MTSFDPSLVLRSRAAHISSKTKAPLGPAAAVIARVLWSLVVAEDVPLLKTDPRKVRGQHYDCVVNGVELGGGSIRIHRPDVQKAIFEEILQIPPEIAQARFESVEKHPRQQFGILYRGVPTMCHDNTWQATVAEMVNIADVV